MTNHIYTTTELVANPATLRQHSLGDYISVKCDHCGDVFSTTCKGLEQRLRRSPLALYCRQGCTGRPKSCQNPTNTNSVPISAVNIAADISILDSFRSGQPLSIRCECGTVFSRTKKKIIDKQKYQGTLLPRCSLGCPAIDRGKIDQFAVLECAECHNDFVRSTAKARYAQKHSTLLFCSRSCSSIHTNRSRINRTRSAMEEYIMVQLEKEFPDLDIRPNDRQEIGWELDIYFPDLGLAIEVNGPVHYRAIYGEGTLKKVQRNDHLKAVACKFADITLYTLDISNVQKVTDREMEKCLAEALEVVRLRLHR